MRLALTADWHLRGKDLDVAINQLRAMVRECAAKGVNVVCVAGDIFDAANIHDAHGTTGAIAGALLRVLGNSKLQWLMVPGNHDYRNAAQTDALAVLESLPNVQVVRGRMWISIGEMYCFCCPWDWSGLEAEAVLEKEISSRLHGNSRTSLLLAHISVIGAKLNAFRTYEGGGGWCLTREALDRLSDHFDRLCIGDFHRRQELVAGKGGYVGALRQLNFGEEGNQQGFEIWDTETNQVEWIELSEAPRYSTVEVTKQEEIDTLVIDDTDNVKVRCVGFTPERHKIQDMESSGAVVEQIVEPVERVARAEAVPEGILSDHHAQIDLWASCQTPVVEGEALKRLHDLYNEVSASEQGAGPASPEEVVAVAASSESSDFITEAMAQ